MSTQYNMKERTHYNGNQPKDLQSCYQTNNDMHSRNKIWRFQNINDAGDRRNEITKNNHGEHTERLNRKRRNKSEQFLRLKR